jgi:uncharacterized protein
MSHSTGAEPITAVVRRRIRAGAEQEFEAIMQEFVCFVLQQPGHLGLTVVRDSPNSLDYTIFDRFASAEDRRAFLQRPEYTCWMDRLRTVSERDPEIEEMGGLAFWVTLPDRPPRKPPPRLKLALLTLVGVYPLSMLLPLIVVPVTPAWPSWLRGLLIGSLIVACLTWLVMPSLTRLFEKWLFPQPSTIEGTSK